MRIGILGTADIAFRRFLPALEKCNGIKYAGVASRTPEKGVSFKKAYGGEIYNGYDSLLSDESIDAVYVPLPPALHFEWAKKALEKGKHVFLEKPATPNIKDTETLVQIAKSYNLVLHENYMFIYHKQIVEIRKIITSGEIGEVRLIQACFGFPFRGAQDFRYSKEMGGGALLDCGGYPIRLARLLLGNTAVLVDGFLSKSNEFDVDTYGNAVLRAANGLTAQVAFGIDNSYQCCLAIWGSEGSLMADRVFTPPPDFCTKLKLQLSGYTKNIEVGYDDSFYQSLRVFQDCVVNEKRRLESYVDILQQGTIVEKLHNML